MTADLSAFLLARVAERQSDVERRGAYAVGHTKRCIFEGGYEGTGSCDCGAVARVLAQCAAIREVVALHPHRECSEYERTWGSSTFGCETCHEFDGIVCAEGWCGTLRALAKPYADHDDFRPEEWA
jgi:hypothetical protein